MASSVSVYKSTNGGTTWVPESTGLKGSSPVRFSNDSAGNVYLITSTTYNLSSGNGLYVFSGSKWVDIGSSFMSKNYDPSNTSVFNSLSGNGSSLYIGTAFGAFKSTDGGKTWQDNNAGINADNVNGLVVTNDGTKIISAPAGVFYQKAGDSTWTHSFPVSGYNGVAGNSNATVYIDKNNTVYILGKIIGPNSYSSYPREVWESKDNGKTWSIDTAGIFKTQLYKFFVDENGNQYMAYFKYAGGKLPVFMKAPGKSWGYDTSGIPGSNFNYPNSFGTDGMGNVYFSVTAGARNLVYRKAALPG